MRKYFAKKYYEKCIRVIVDSGKTEDIEEHIIKHATELNEPNRNKQSWSASMHNLIDIYDAKYDIPHDLDVQIRKLEEHHQKHPEERTPLPGKQVLFT